MKKHTLILLMASIHFNLSASLIPEYSGRERYQNFTDDFKKQADAADVKLKNLERRKKEYVLEEHVVFKHHANSPYKKLTPNKSYRTLHISQFATDEEVKTQFNTILKTLHDNKDAPSMLVAHQAYKNIKQHRDVKALYAKLEHNLHQTVFKKDTLFVRNFTGLKKYHVNLEDVSHALTESIKLSEMLKDCENPSIKDCENPSWNPLSIKYICAYSLIFYTGKFIGKSFFNNKNDKSYDI